MGGLGVVWGWRRLLGDGWKGGCTPENLWGGSKQLLDYLALKNTTEPNAICNQTVSDMSGFLWCLIDSAIPRARESMRDMPQIQHQPEPYMYTQCVYHYQVSQRYIYRADMV